MSYRTPMLSFSWKIQEKNSDFQPLKTLYIITIVNILLLAYNEYFTSLYIVFVLVYESLVYVVLHQ